MTKTIITLLIGLIIGALLMGLIIWNLMPAKMLNVVKSKYDFEKTVSILEESSYENGWEVLHKYDIGDCLYSAGFDEKIIKVNILSICHSEYSYSILEDDENKKIAAIMPCRLSVFENSNGDVFVTRMNIGLMSKMFGGKIEKIMAYVAADDEKILQDVIE